MKKLILLMLLFSFAMIGCQEADFAVNEEEIKKEGSSGKGEREISNIEYANNVLELKQLIDNAQASDIIMVDFNYGYVNINSYFVIDNSDEITIMGVERNDGSMPIIKIGPDVEFLFKVRKDQIKITGLHLKGNLLEDANGNFIAGNQDAEHIKSSTAIYVKSGKECEITSCEIEGFKYAAILVKELNGNKIDATRVFDCEIHHNRYLYNGNGTGYGVSVGNGGYAYVNACTFHTNRHDIAGDGNELSSYRVENTIFDVPEDDNLVFHAVDMHGWHADSAEVAGGNMYIINNTFNNINSKGICIRGLPSGKCIIAGNTFIHSNSHYAIRQETSNLKDLTYDDYYKSGRLYASDNTFLGSSPNENDSWVVSWSNGSSTSSWDMISNNPDCVELDEMLIGDFSGDGIDDVFTIDLNHNWLVSESGKRTNTYTDYQDDLRWRKIKNGWPYDINTLRVGNFDAPKAHDECEDIFWIYDGNSSDGQDSWYFLDPDNPTPQDIWYNAPENIEIDDLLLGDFNGDGYTDVFWVEVRYDGADSSVEYDWMVYYMNSGVECYRTTTWPINVSQMGVVNFWEDAGQYQTDEILYWYPTNGQYYTRNISTSTAHGWIYKSAPVDFDEYFLVGDFTGNDDHISDVIYSNGSQLLIYEDGDVSSSLWSYSSYSISSLRTGDFNGDSKTDIFTVK